MSYSVCFNCMQMVGGYEKYCLPCQKKYGLPNVPEFWKTHNWADVEPERAKVISNETYTAKHDPEGPPPANRHQRRAAASRRKR